MTVTFEPFMHFKNWFSVVFLDPVFMKFSPIIEQSPHNWETTVCQNETLTDFYTKIICHYAWKTLKTTL